jgi:hypothetical protein
MKERLKLGIISTIKVFKFILIVILVKPYHESKFVNRYNENLEKLRKKCGLGPNNIP